MLKFVSMCFLLSFFLCSCDSGTKEDKWYERDVKLTEKVLCDKELDGDSFLVAYELNGKIKVGYQLNVTGEKELPLSYSVFWVFLNENNNVIGIDKKPEVVRQKMTTKKGLVYSEEIAYQYVDYMSSKKVKVIVNIFKTDDFKNIQKQSEHNQYVKNNICEIEL